MYLDFEEDIKEIDKKLKLLQDDLTSSNSDIEDCQRERDRVLEILYKNLTSWQVTQVARHPGRPLFLDYVRTIFCDFIEIHGDRLFADDRSIITGWATLQDQKVMVIGQEKGSDTESRLERNFGMANPEGYRKALRVARIAEKFKKPILIFIDTPGAYPGIDAEERGQGEAIARNIMEFFSLKVPIIATVIGEGGSGGALGIGVADNVFMLEYSMYSVISPESCASILWHDVTKAKQAAECLKYTAPYLKEFGVIDAIIPEPLGGAHRDKMAIMQTVESHLVEILKKLKKKRVSVLLNDRYKRFRKLGYFIEH